MNISRRLINIPVIRQDFVFIEGFFLLAGTDFFIIISNLPIIARLFGIVAFQSIVKELVVYFFYRLVAVVDIQVGPALIDIVCGVFPAIMTGRSSTDSSADSFTHNCNSPFFDEAGGESEVISLCYFCESNAKALLTTCGRQKMLCALRGGGALPVVCGQPPPGLPFEKGTLDPAETSRDGPCRW